MKTQPDALFTLINSLTRPEQKAFKKKLNTYKLKGRKNHFLILFVTLRKMDKYSYDLLVDLTKGKILRSALSSFKSQLKRKLIDFLRENDNHHYKRWHEMLEDAHILCRRGVFDEAHQVLEQLKKEASEANRKYYVIAALRIEALMVQQLNERDVVSATKTLGASLVETSADLLLTSQVYNFYTSVIAITFMGNMAVRDNAVLSQLRALYKGDVYKLDLTLLNIDQKSLLLVGKYTLVRLLGKTGDLFSIVEERLKLLKSNFGYFKKYQPQNIATVYVDYIETCTLVQKEAAFQATLGEFKRYIDVQFPGAVFLNSFYVYLRQSYVIHNAKEHDKLNKAVQHLEPFYLDNPALPIINKKMFEISLLWGYYKLHDYNKALDYSRKLMEEDISEEAAEDIVDLIKIVALAIRFEQLMVNGFRKEEIHAFISFTTSGYHYFRKKKGKDYRLELALIKVFRETEKIPEKRMLVPILTDLRALIQTWLSEDIAYVQTFNLGFRILDWIDKQILIIG